MVASGDEEYSRWASHGLAYPWSEKAVAGCFVTAPNALYLMLGLMFMWVRANYS